MLNSQASVETNDAAQPEVQVLSTQAPTAQVQTVARGTERKVAFSTEGVVCKTHIGGQALIEGIMMRGKYNWALAVRKPNGTIHVEEHDLLSGHDKNAWMYKPVVRGCTAMVESLALGYQALQIAANYAMEDFDDDVRQLEEQQDTEPTKGNTDAAVVEKQQDTEPTKGNTDAEVVEKQEDTEPTKGNTDAEVVEKQSALPKPVMTATMIIGILLGIGIFVVAPALLTNLLVGDYAERTLLWNLVDGVIRVAIFIAYIWIIGRVEDIKRMFGYHGAEHKTIHCYEHGLDLEVGNAQQFPTLHVRCGTAFMLTTLIIAIIVFTVAPVGALINAMGVQNDILRLALVILSRIILLPLIAGLSYETTVKWAGAHPDYPLVKVVLWPGMQLQRLTTNPPDDSMIECAIAAMQRVLDREHREQQAAT